MRGLICDLKRAEFFVAQSGAEIVVFNLRVEQPGFAVDLNLDPAVGDAAPVPVVGTFADDRLRRIAELAGQQAEGGGEVITVALAGCEDLFAKFQKAVVRDDLDLRAEGGIRPRYLKART